MNNESTTTKLVHTSVTLRRQTRDTLAQIAREMAANDRRERIGMGEVIETLLQPVLEERARST